MRFCSCSNYVRRTRNKTSTTFFEFSRTINDECSMKRNHSKKRTRITKLRYELSSTPRRWLHYHTFTTNCQDNSSWNLGFFRTKPNFSLKTRSKAIFYWSWNWQWKLGQLSKQLFWCKEYSITFHPVALWLTRFFTFSAACDLRSLQHLCDLYALGS